ncbi:MAG: sigma-54-dependent Fis family transcriptional regulator [Burkholderiaceae bacterium]|nr:sigma-54-dependent Fis family transcriptional regulator [Burkholderiaceae bacterium]
MHSEQRRHIETVMQLAGAGSSAASALRHDEIIRDSWLRCVHQHGLDPTRMQEAVIRPAHLVREQQDRLEDFLQIARYGLESLYQLVSGLGYVVLLTNSRGVTVDFIGDLQMDPALRKAGLYLGSDWSEQLVGTNGVGTCLSTGEALVVHLDDHFDATHIPLTCTAAPIYDPLGEMTAVLDISALTAPSHKDSQHLALQLVKMYSHQIETAHFLYRYRQDWILRLSAAPEFLEVNPEYLLAIDTAGRVIGHNHRAQRLFGETGICGLLGRRVDELLNVAVDDLPRFVSVQPADRRAVILAGTKRLLFLSVLTPGRVHASGAHARSQPSLPPELAALSGGDPEIDRQVERAAKLINSPISILIHGETGTGKEFFAKAIHMSSARRKGPFVPVNCAAIPDALLESELFGYAPGSFSGASTKGKRGLVQQADGGTLFLDEIGDMPRPMQAKLLRVLSEREVFPVGAVDAVPVNIRVIAATHCDLEAMARRGEFRDDLYYRLCGARFVLPALRHRKDRDWVIDQILERTGHKHESARPDIDAAAREALLQHDWPGNLREVANVIEYAATVCQDNMITLADLPEHFGRTGGRVAADPRSELFPTGVRSEAAELLATMKSTRWNVTAAAAVLGVSRVTLYRRMKRFGISPPT